MSEPSAKTIETCQLALDPPEAIRLRQQRVEREELREAEALRRGPNVHWSMFSAPWMLDKALTLAGLRSLGERLANRPVLRKFVVSHPAISPSLDGFRLLHLSDLHFDDRPGFVDAACALLDGTQCDLCVITGDYRFYNSGPAINLTEGMRAIVGGIQSRHGCYGVLGNHDRLQYVPKLEHAGLSMLVNQGEAIRIGDATIWLAGTDDPHFYRSDSIELAMRGAPDDAFVVGLIHSPEIIREAERRGVHLYLCGHTHGGQVCLPGRIPLYVNARCPYRCTTGRWKWKGMLGYTTSGLGTTDLPIRFFCPPEAVLFTLRHGEPGIAAR